MRRQKDWLKAYCELAKYSEAPDIFNWWAGVGVIAGALRRKVYIDQKVFIWTPNFYIIFVAPPGVATKSTSMNNAVKLYKQVGGLKLGPNAITWQQLITSMSASCEAVPMPDGSFLNISCLTFASSEFGSLVNLQDRDMLNVLTDLWDGHHDAWEKQTKSQGSDLIENPWINIIACTTPSWLEDNLPKAAIGGGFVSRCVFVFAEEKSKLIAYPKLMMPEGWYERFSEALVHDLEAISMLKGEFLLDSDALEYGIEWYENHHKNPPIYMQSEEFIGYMARKQGHIHKLAMVLSASESDSMVITRSHLERAIRMMGAVEKGLPDVFRKINTTEEMSNLERVFAAIIECGGKIESEALYNRFVHMMPKHKFDELITSGLSTGRLLQVSNGIGTTYEIRPGRGKPAGSLQKAHEIAAALEDPKSEVVGF